MSKKEQLNLYLSTTIKRRLKRHVKRSRPATTASAITEVALTEYLDKQEAAAK